MTLIKSISGIRGTIGGMPGEGLSPLDIVRFASAYGTWVRRTTGEARPKVVIGRDARSSGPMLNALVSGSLAGTGIDVIDLGWAATPTVEIAVTGEKADGGIILTASHNPEEWNALKLLNARGEFVSSQDGEAILEIADQEQYLFEGVQGLGSVSLLEGYGQRHIDKIKQLDLVDIPAITSAGFRVAIDCVNSVGGLVLPDLLRSLGVREIIELYCEPTGRFPHNPEPLPDNLNDLSEAVIKNNADVGFAVDPDVDRLAIVNEDGSMFGEEYTLVAVADYVLQHRKGSAVSNLSSTRALKDVTLGHGCNYYAAAVGEVNVVELMKRHRAVIGGEGNGGVIYPALHHGRDALAGIALFLSHLARKRVPCSDLRKSYPDYTIVKRRMDLPAGMDLMPVFDRLEQQYPESQCDRTDGLKLDFDDGWIHLRKSNTEPIIRIYAESVNAEKADALAAMMIRSLSEAIGR